MFKFISFTMIHKVWVWSFEDTCINSFDKYLLFLKKIKILKLNPLIRWAKNLPQKAVLHIKSVNASSCDINWIFSLNNKKGFSRNKLRVTYVSKYSMYIYSA